MAIPHPTTRADTENTDSLGFEAVCQTQVDEWTGWLDRIESLIERFPWPTLLLALGVGYVLGRRMR